ncbi:MAG: 2-hydroxychromene-2-carboxylate isomerase [uncultured Lysobacter sp.]|uniref:2-hydroxychromene-2-carboxylate isomerase n=1 Tax=uncultured Lysobacter sp. TaxID=271060 RepID=A0A6J4L001_9GAMM|nr:MAG: 2-hydroxychromene-2-carboxylate isomerase [uncultured Lysobacter sp.]
MNAADHRAHVAWYFDFISPFAYLQWQAVKTLTQCEVDCRPILFAGLLKHHGHKGPAEIPAKRLFTYRHAQWRANRAGVPLTFPPAHPFNPLPALRLCAAAGSTAGVIDTIFNHIWRDGAAVDTPDAVAALAQELGVSDPAAALADPAVKLQLERNFACALEDGVFGVPTLVVDGQLFWGEDATEMFVDHLGNRQLFTTPQMQRLSGLPIGAARPGIA